MSATVDIGQGEQEAILAWADGHVGSFVDFGCYDGVRFSNTAALADLGWGGLCIDAAPDATAACAVLYADRPDISVILGAFATDTPLVTIHWSPGNPYSSRRPNLRGDITLAPIEMATLNLEVLADRIVELSGPLFCSIDLEGNSLEALEWLLDHRHPDCVCVEANNPADRSVVHGWLDAGWRDIPINPHNLLFIRR